MSLFRFFARKIFALIVLFTAVSFIGCQIETEPKNNGFESEPENTGFIPVGEWLSDYDKYTITNETFEYFMAGSEDNGVTYPDTRIKGSIEKAVDFTTNAGALIVKTTETTVSTPGMYIGVYYKDITTSSIKISTGINPDYSTVEAVSLSDALLLFTVDNADTHVQMWGSYTK
ncbi:MAG: hypothetical protein LBV17_11540 [Treponema sp.]|jgi:hypothetical protein|nr:hypothetical protein [Treponema sp.]